MLDVAPDGTFELTLSPDPHDGTWLKLDPDAVCAITRDYVVDPAQGRRVEWHIEAVDPPSTWREDDDDLARRFRATLTWIREQAQLVPLASVKPTALPGPSPVPPVPSGWPAADAPSAMAAFDPEPTQALVI